jgi:hypothetical protein
LDPDRIKPFYSHQHIELRVGNDSCDKQPHYKIVILPVLLHAVP